MPLSLALWGIKPKPYHNLCQNDTFEFYKCNKLVTLFKIYVTTCSNNLTHTPSKALKLNECLSIIL
jgi:hypothetical protein